MNLMTEVGARADDQMGCNYDGFSGSNMRVRARWRFMIGGCFRLTHRECTTECSECDIISTD